MSFCSTSPFQSTVKSYEKLAELNIRVIFLDPASLVQLYVLKFFFCRTIVTFAHSNKEFVRMYHQVHSCMMVEK